jgi:hypothetical protein
MSVHTDQAMRPTALSRFSAFVEDPRLSITGSAYHGDSTLQWRTRTLDYRLAGIARFEVGNFSAATDGGLFFGYFPDYKETQTTATNWLYSRSRTWNGVSAVSDCWDRISVNAIFHERPAEQVEEISCRADVGGSTNVSFGASRMTQTRLNPFPDSGFYIHCGLAGRLAGSDLSVHTGVDAGNPCAVPFSVQIDRKSAGGFVKVLVARIPGSLKLPLSSIAYLCRRDFEEAAKDGVFPDMTLLECRTSIFGSKGLVTSMDLCSVIHGRGGDLTAAVSAQGRSMVDYRVEYSCRGTSGTSQTIHNVNLALQRDVSARLAVLVSCKYYYKDSGFQSVFLRVPLDIAVLPAMTVSPFVTVYSNTNGERALGAGLKQTLQCFEKTRCEWSGRISKDERNIRDWDVSVRTNFLF